jgi:adenosine deaminase
MNTTLTAIEASRLKKLPKAEVHLHLEGCFEAVTIAQWAKAEGVSLPRPQEDLFTFSGLADFLGFLDLASGLASTPQRLVEMSYGLCQRLADNGTGYADVIFNPTHWHTWHGRLDAMLDAMDTGFKEAEQDGLPSVGLCISLLRTQSADEAAYSARSRTRFHADGGQHSAVMEDSIPHDRGQRSALMADTIPC